jgi:hypothetical protein
MANDGKPSRFWRWQYWVVTKWQPPEKIKGEAVDRIHVGGFAIMLATKYGTEGRNIFAANDTLAEAFGTSPGTVRRLKRLAIGCGILKYTGGYVGRGVGVMEISYPGGENKDHNSDAVCPAGCDECCRIEASAGDDVWKRADARTAAWEQHCKATGRPVAA